MNNTIIDKIKCQHKNQIAYLNAVFKKCQFNIIDTPAEFQTDGTIKSPDRFEAVIENGKRDIADNLAMLIKTAVKLGYKNRKTLMNFKKIEGEGNFILNEPLLNYLVDLDVMFSGKDLLPKKNLNEFISVKAGFEDKSFQR